jgi:RNA recognition motif-containing protein
MQEHPLTRILRIKGLPKVCEENKTRLAQFFSTYGPIQIRQCKSVVFVVFFDERSSAQAKASLESLENLELIVDYALPSSPYAYPEPTVNSLACIFEAIATNSTLYNKVLDSMNSLNLPSPFHTTCKEVVVLEAAQKLLSQREQEQKKEKEKPNFEQSKSFPTRIDGRTRLYLKNVDATNFKHWIQKFGFKAKVDCFSKGKMRNQAFLTFEDAQSCTIAYSILKASGQDVHYSEKWE